MSTDKMYMARCLQIAELGRPACRTNPLVGCVIAHDDTIISEGFHRVYGDAHAEVDALQRVRIEDKHLLPQSTLYVNLAPCNHTGKTPPCTDAILRSGIKRVVVAMNEIHDEADGGIKRLRQHGVEVVTGILEENAKALNGHFANVINRTRPWITLKWAESSNGVLGDSDKRIMLSSDQSQRWTHDLRRNHNAILIGRNTLEVDDPSLTTRLVPGPHPLRIILAGSQPLRGNYACFKDQHPTIIISELTAPDSLPKHIRWKQMVRATGFLQDICAYLVDEYSVGFLLVEGGKQVHQSFLDENMWDEIWRIQNQSAVDGNILAPTISNNPAATFKSADDTIEIFRNSSNAALRLR